MHAYSPLEINAQIILKGGVHINTYNYGLIYYDSIGYLGHTKALAFNNSHLNITCHLEISLWSILLLLYFSKEYFLIAFQQQRRFNAL